MRNTIKAPLNTLLTASLAVALIGCSEQSEQAADAEMAAADEPVAEAPAVVVADNPFFVEWTTPYGIPPFAEIQDEHYMPAFERGIEELQADVAAIRERLAADGWRVGDLRTRPSALTPGRPEVSFYARRGADVVALDYAEEEVVQTRATLGKLGAMLRERCTLLGQVGATLGQRSALLGEPSSPLGKLGAPRGQPPAQAAALLEHGHRDARLAQAACHASARARAASASCLSSSSRGESRTA